MEKIQIIIGSTRDERVGDKVAKWVYGIAKRREDFDVELIDLRDWNIPFFNDASPAFNPPKKKIIKEWANKIAEADGYIFVTPEYNHGYPAVLKNALDYLYNEWNNKPVAFVAYGGTVGGSRAVEQLRLVAIELQMAPIREAVYIPLIWDALDESGNPKNKSLEKTANKMISSLLWWTKALNYARKELPKSENI